jgi:hypothetical protein
LKNPPGRYPWEGAADEQQTRAWEQKYGQVAAGYAACRLIAQVGPGSVHSEVDAVLRLHDQMACNGDQLKLA